MKITVAICTWNRAALLDQTLCEMHKLEIPTGVEWELLVVNNNCTDGTDAVVAEHAKGLPILRLFEARPGLSNARNCAIAAANGGLILWTDDDVLVSSNWLAQYAAAAERHHATAFFGGPIEPWFEGSPPEWLLAVWPHVAGVYATKEVGASALPVSENNLPYGANFAVRTEYQLRHPYDPMLGRRPGSYLSWEETTVLRTMLRNSLTGQWVPEARVRHFIPKERQTRRYIREWFSGEGERRAQENSAQDLAMLFGRPRCFWRVFFAEEAKYQIARLFCPPRVWIEALIKSAIAWGELQAWPKYACGKAPGMKIGERPDGPS